MRLNLLRTHLMYYILNLLSKFSHQTRPIGILCCFLMMDVYCLQSEPTPCALKIFSHHPIFGKVRLPNATMPRSRKKPWVLSLLALHCAAPRYQQKTEGRLEIWGREITQEKGRTRHKQHLKLSKHKSALKLPVSFHLMVGKRKCSFLFCCWGEMLQELPGVHQHIETYMKLFAHLLYLRQPKA